MPGAKTSQSGLDLTGDESAIAARLFPDPDEGSMPEGDVAQTGSPSSDGDSTGATPTDADGEMVAGTQDEEKNDAGGDTKSTDGQGEDSKDAEDTDDVDPEVAAKITALEDELLGDQHTEPDSDPEWRTRAGDMTRKFNEEHRESLEYKANVEAALATVGRQLVQTSNGLQIATADDYKDERVQPVDVEDAWKGLPSELQTLLRSDVVDVDSIRKAVQLAHDNGARQLAAKLTAVTAKAADRILAKNEADMLFSEFATEKRSDGKLKFPSLDDSVVMQKFARACNAQDESMTWIREQGYRDAAANKVGLELAYLRTFHARHEALTLQAEAKRQKQTTDKNNKQKMSVPGSGGSSTDANRSSKSQEESTLDMVVKSFVGSTHNEDGVPYLR